MEPHQFGDEPSNIILKPQISQWFRSEIDDAAQMLFDSNRYSDPYTGGQVLDPAHNDPHLQTSLSRRLPKTRISPTAINAHPNTLEVFSSANDWSANKGITFDLGFLGGAHQTESTAHPFYVTPNRRIQAEQVEAVMETDPNTKMRKETLGVEFFLQEEPAPREQYDRHLFGENKRSTKLTLIGISLCALLILPLLNLK
jgi:hypothetical protein